MKYFRIIQKNETHDGVYEVFTGSGSIIKTTTINQFQKHKTVDFWKNSDKNKISVCNLINGTDSGSYPPLTEKYQTLTIYNSDICRSVNLYYIRDAKYEGIPGYRYETKDDYLNEMGPEFSNECFCVNKIRNIIAKKNGCLYHGALDLSTCLGEFFF